MSFRLTFLPGYLLLLVGFAAAQNASPPAQPQQSYTLRAGTNVVLVPATVQTKSGEVIYGLKANQFVVEDNGVAQAVHLDETSDLQGLTLMVLVQCSRSAVAQFGNISGLGTMVDALVGGAPRQVAVGTYGKEPTLIGEFSDNPDDAAVAIGHIRPCDDKEAATFDAVAWGSALLDARKDSNRHVILLVSEIRDHGSRKDPAEVIAALGRTNTVVDAVAFSPGKSEILGGLRFGGGPGPLGLMMMAVNAAKKNAPKTLASLSGGEYVSFTNRNAFDNGIHQLSNRIHNYYLLSFTPQMADNGQPAEGMHSLRVRVPEYPDARINARESYFSGTLEASEAQ